MDATLTQKITAQGKQVEAVQGQLESFKKGFPFLSLLCPATSARGIQVWNENQVQHYQSFFSRRAPELEIVKFVPASGAASRMFKDLFSFLETDGDLSKNGFTQKFIGNLSKFAFFQDLDGVLQQEGESIASLLENKEYKKLVAALLTETGLNYGNLPKGLLKFHAYGNANRCPAEEHLIEGIQYGVGRDKQVRIHFTVSPEHEEGFVKEINQHLPRLQESTGLVFKVSYSHQKKSTDTIAVDESNEPFLEEDGSLLFRPSGHGALLENLNEVAGDLIFIKNIDNVVPDRLKPVTKSYKMALAGLLLEVQSRIFEALRALEEVSFKSVSKAKEVYVLDLGGLVPEGIQNASLAEQAAFFHAKLNRPIRVCGMVKNTGEPGGGPFWIHEKDGTQSLQILETAQIDLNDATSKQHFQASTHFNPVDLVCGTRDYRGQAFDLPQFRDMNTGFITEKSKSGKVLKALELPGLWNGAMANWNTLFVEVPIITFNPVKTINDLLREEHQA
ncbi:MAG: DUF4301 family protein [Algoriphagus sp.]|nr:DUF4301 family protein [Algoriphagus sp.]